MKPLKKTDWSLYSTILLIIICIQGSLQHSDRRELNDDYRFDPEDRRVGLKDQRVNEEPALNVPQHVQDVRADSRRSRIDAQDIRTDFREIRTELGGRREARLSGRFNLASRSDSKEGMSNVRRERQTRFNERQSDERTDSRNHRERFEQLERVRRTSRLSRSEDRFNSRRNSRESNLPVIRRFNAERFNRRASQERANGQDSLRGRFNNERLDRRTLDSQRFSTRGNSQRRYINERSETRDNRRELRQNSRDAVRDNNQRRQNSERFDRMRSTPERTNRLLTQTRRNLNKESRRQETRIFRAQTSNNRREERSQENLNEARLRREDTHKAANRVDKARVAIDHQETSRSLENDRRVEVRSQSSRASEMSHRITDDDVKERTESQLALNFSQRDSRIGPSTLKNNSAVIVSTIQAALVLLLVLQMVGNKAKQPFSNAFRFNTWTSMFSHVKSA